MPHIPLFLQNRRVQIFLGLLLCAAILTACATQPKPSAEHPPGFFSGLLHGFIILFSFIASIFTDYRIYAFPNSGWWYDLGYLLGASAFLGGSGAGANRSAPADPKATSGGL